MQLICIIYCNLNIKYRLINNLFFKKYIYVNFFILLLIIFLLCKSKVKKKKKSCYIFTSIKIGTYLCWSVYFYWLNTSKVLYVMVGNRVNYCVNVIMTRRDKKAQFTLQYVGSSKILTSDGWCVLSFYANSFQSWTSWRTKKMKSS